MLKSPKIGSMIRLLFYFLFALVPLIMYSGTTELFEFNKMLFIYFIAAAVGTLFVTDIILYNRKVQFPKILSYALLLFLASQIVSTFFSIDIHTSLFGYYGRFNGGLFSIIAYMILFYTFIQYFNVATLDKLLKISLFSSTAVIFWGLPGKVGHDLSCLLFTGQFNNTCWTDQFRPSERMFSTLGQPNWLGAYLAIQCFIGIYFLVKAFKDKQMRNQVILLLYTFLNISSILFTRSRSSLAALLAGFAILPFCLLFVNRTEKKLFKSLFIYGYIILILLFSMIIFQTGVEKIDSVIKFVPNLLSTSEKQVKPMPAPKAPAPQSSFNSGVTDSFDIRKIVWKGAIDLGNKYPLFGTGVETFAYSYYFVRPVEHNLTSEWDFLYNKAHNEFLNYFATTGYFGIITYLLMISAVFYVGFSYIIRSKSSHAWLIFCLLLAYLTIHVTNFFGFSTTSVNIFFYLIPAFVYVLHRSKEADTVVTKTKSFQRKALLILPIGFFLYVIFFLIQYFTADIRFSAAEAYSRSGEYQQAAIEYNDLMKIHYEHVYEDKLSYVLANLSYVAAYQKDKKTSADLLKLAQFYNQKSLNASPANINYWKTSVKNDYLFYQTELDPKYIKDGVESLAAARKISPTDPKLPYSQALFYSVLEDEEKDNDIKQALQQKSLSAINTAIKLKSDYRDSYFLKGQLLKKYGNKEEAKKTFQFILDHLEKNDVEVKKELEKL